MYSATIRHLATVDGLGEKGKWPAGAEWKKGGRIEWKNGINNV